MGQESGVHSILILNLTKDVQRRHSLAVKFVDECNYRGIAHPANFHEFFGLGFHPLGIVDHHQGAVHGGQYPVGIL